MKTDLFDYPLPARLIAQQPADRRDESRLLVVHRAGHTVEVRFDPLNPAPVEIWFQGQLQHAAVPVDPVVNGQLPSAKRHQAAELEPTGINFVELLKQKQERE